MNQTASELTRQQMRENLQEIIKTKSFSTGAPITLASGKTSTHYFNMKPSMLDPEGSFLIASMMLDVIETFGQKFDFLGGLELGAVPIASAIAPVSHLRSTPINTFLIRKKPKDHGTESLIEGLQKGETLKGKNIIIVEDVTTTGGSALKAIKAVRGDGAIVDHVITIVDREEGAEETFAAEGLKLSSLFKKSDFI